MHLPSLVKSFIKLIINLISMIHLLKAKAGLISIHELLNSITIYENEDNPYVWQDLSSI
jgi:hypothetical protein